MEKIYFYGASFRTKNAIENNKKYMTYEIMGILDSDLHKWGKQMDVYAIIPPHSFIDTNHDKIIIMCSSAIMLKDKLIKLGAKPEKIITNGCEYLFDKEFEERFSLHYRNKNKVLLKDLYLIKESELVVYTAIFGYYDILKDPQFINKNICYVCFTDNPMLTSNVWKIIYVEKKFEDNNRCAKEFKIKPYLFLNDFKYSVWVDANVIIKVDLFKFFINECGASGITFPLHNERNCIYKEAKICLKLNKDKSHLILKQMEKYRNEQYPEENELIMGRLILRKHNEESVKKLMESWWHEIENGSRRDQLSFNYVSWKNNINYDIISDTVFGGIQNTFFEIEEHL